MSIFINRLAKRLGTIEKAMLGDPNIHSRLSSKDLAELRKYVAKSGRMTDAAHKGGSGVRRMLIGGPAAQQVLKSRYAQGGMLGPGGVVFGDLGMRPELRAALSNINRRISGGPSASAAPVGADLKTVAKRSPGQLLNVGFGLGFPAMGVHSALTADPNDPEAGARGIGSALLGGAGFLAATPYGLGGTILASSLGSSLGSELGSLFSGGEQGLENSQTNPILDAALPLAYNSYDLNTVGRL